MHTPFSINRKNKWWIDTHKKLSDFRDSMHVKVVDTRFNMNCNARLLFKAGLIEQTLDNHHLKTSKF